MAGSSRDGGIGYSCGCKETFDENGVRRFTPCENPEHYSEPCGCGNIGGNPFFCARHFILAGATWILGFAAIGYLLYMLIRWAIR